MNCSKTLAKNQMIPGNNKPDLVQVQVLLKSMNLLRSAYLFIDAVSKKGAGMLSKTESQPLLRPTYLSTWLSAVNYDIFRFSQ